MLELRSQPFNLPHLSLFKKPTTTEMIWLHLNLPCCFCLTKTISENDWKLQIWCSFDWLVRENSFQGSCINSFCFARKLNIPKEKSVIPRFSDNSAQDFYGEKTSALVVFRASILRDKNFDCDKDEWVDSKWEERFTKKGHCNSRLFSKRRIKSNLY